MSGRYTPKVYTIVIALTFIFCMLFSADIHAAEEGAQIVFTQEESEFIASHSKLRVGYVQDRIPVSFSDKNDEFAGISRYIIDHIGEVCGLQFEYVPLPAGDVTYKYITSQNLDLVTSVEYNSENQNARGILISNPYLSSRKVVVAKSNMTFDPGAHMSVAISTGSQTLRKVLNRSFPNFELKDYDSIEDCFDAVSAGEADLMIQNQYVVEYWISKPKYEKLKVIPVTGLDDAMCFSSVVEIENSGTGLSEKDGLTLIQILNKAIASMTEDETGSYIIQAIMENQYSYNFTDFLSRYRYAVTILVISLIIIVILAVKLIRQKLRFAKTDAEAKAKEQFLNTMSHEIRTPLNGLIGLNNLMEMNKDNKEKLEGYLQKSTTTAKYLLTLVNDILDSSRLQANKLQLISNRVDVYSMLENIDSLAATGMKDKNIDYSVTTDITAPVIMGDEIRIQQVILNLLDNARKFTNEGGKVDLLFVQEKQSDGMILTTVKVTDTGRGMSEEFQKHIFDAFAQELDTVSKGNQGTGLGLSISCRLAKLMGGDLSCESRKGKGSTFTFTFLSEAADMPENGEEKEETKHNNHPRILVAEDNELNSEILLELLHGSGFEADLAQNGKIAYDIFSSSEEGKYGVILMDLLMPEMNGFEAAKAIRALDRKDAETVRIFACTANSFSEDRQKALECGMNDFIAKPIDINDLLKKLSES